MIRKITTIVKKLTNFPKRSEYKNSIEYGQNVELWLESEKERSVELNALIPQLNSSIDDMNNLSTDLTSKHTAVTNSLSTIEGIQTNLTTNIMQDIDEKHNQINTMYSGIVTHMTGLNIQTTTIPSTENGSVVYDGATTTYTFKIPKGVKGDRGLKGDKGDRGDRGYKGDRGLQGIQGVKGDKGDRGTRGAKGDKGDTGATPSLSSLDSRYALKAGAKGQDFSGREIYSHSFLRTVGNGGWYSQTHGGGWHMQDSTWIRAYGGKAVLVTNTSQTQSIYTHGGIRANKGFYWGGQSLDSRYPSRRATATVEGGIKSRLSGTTLYTSDNGSNP